MSEATALKMAMLDLSRDGATVFRNHVGLGVFGNMQRIPGGGDVIVHNARIAQCGLFEGSGDIIGWKTVTVTPDMVGKRVAVFLSAEVKSSSGRMRDAQRSWMENVSNAGGIAVVYREGDMFSGLNWRPR